MEWYQFLFLIVIGCILCVQQNRILKKLNLLEIQAIKKPCLKAALATRFPNDGENIDFEKLKEMMPKINL